MTDQARVAPLFAAPASGRETVVAACAAEMESFGLSIARAAREMGRGVSQTTLSKWLRGVYNRDVGGCGLALIGGDDLWTTLASSRRCDQIVGRIGVRLPLGAPAQADVLDLAAGILGRRPGAGESKSLIAAARCAGGLHALRRLMARAWVSCQAAGRDRIEAGDLELATEAA